MKYSFTAELICHRVDQVPWRADGTLEIDFTSDNAVTGMMIDLLGEGLQASRMVSDDDLEFFQTQPMAIHESKPGEWHIVNGDVNRYISLYAFFTPLSRIN